MRSFGGADRGNKLVREKGFKGTSYGSAGRGVKLSDISHDVRSAILALVARGTSLERIAVETGASLAVVRLVERYCRM